MDPIRETLPSRYRVVRTLGRGAQGVVFEVVDEATDEHLALKLLSALDETERQLLSAEFETLAGWSHPSLVTPRDFGLTASGLPFFTRELVAGVSWDAAARNAPFPRLWHLAGALCRALGPLHRAGIRHGDIKPTNVMVEGDPDDPRVAVRLIDLSFSASAGAPTALRGTPAYMAPELLFGRQADTRADLYAAGMCLYAALNRGLPLDGDVAAIADRHRRKAPLPPPRVAHPQLEPLADIALRLLAADPADRYVDTAEWEAALTTASPVPLHADAGAAVPAVPPVDGEKIRRTARRLVHACRSDQEPRLTYLIGPRGAGKSGFLAGLKWRLQLHGATVLTAPAAARDTAVFAEVMIAQLPRPTGDKPRGLPTMADLEDLVVSGAKTGPVVFLLDDAHRYSPALTGAVARLIARTAEHPVAFVAACVPTWERNDTWGPGHEITLPPLDRDSLEQWVRRWFPATDPMTIAALEERTGGLPGNVTAVLRHAVEGGSLEHGLRTPLSPQVPTLSPEANRLLVATCLLRTSLVDKATLFSVADIPQAARSAVTHHLCDRGHLLVHGVSLAAPADIDVRKVADALPARDRTELLERCAQAAVTITDRVYVAALRGDSAFVAGHWRDGVEAMTASGRVEAAIHLMRACLEVPLPETERQAIHMRLARSEIPAGQWDAAHRRLEALVARGPDAPLWPTATAWLAHLEARRGNRERAADLLDTAAAANSLETEDRILCAETAFALGDARRAVAFAQNLAQREDETGVAAATLVAKCHGVLGRWDEAALIARKAADRAARIQAASVRAQCLDVLAWICENRGDYDAAAVHLRDAIELHRTCRDAPRLVRSLHALGNVAYWQEAWHDMVTHHAAALQMAAAVDSPRLRNEVVIAAAFSTLCIGRHLQTAVLLDRAQAEAMRIGDRRQWALAEMYRGDLAALRDDLHGAENHWKSALESLDQPGDAALKAELAWELARLYAERSAADTDQVAYWMDQAQALDPEPSGRDVVLLRAITQALFAWRTGDAQDAITRLQSLAEQERRAKRNRWRWQAAALLARLLREQGDEPKASDWIRAAHQALEQLAAQLRAGDALAFWSDPRRRWVRDQFHRVTAEASDDVQAPQVDGVALVQLTELLRALDDSADLDDAWRLSATTCLAVARAQRCLVLQRTPGGWAAVGSAVRPRADTVVHSDFSQSIAESAWVDGTALLTTDATADRRLRDFGSVHHLQLRCVLCTPLLRSDPPTVLYLDTGADTPFSSETAEQIHRLAALMAALFERVRLQRDLREAHGRIAELKSRCATVDLLAPPAAGTAPDTGALEAELPGNSPAMETTRRLAAKLARSDVPAVIWGPAGTPVERVARLVHQHGPRSGSPFVVVDPTAFPDTLVESTLFGHRKGAFSGADGDRVGLLETAQDGTVCITGLENASTKVQVALLRVLQERTFTPLGDTRARRLRARVVCTAAVAPEVLVSRGTLRQDLYYRLCVVTVHLPALDTRKEDIAPWAAAWLRAQRGADGAPPVLTPAAAQALVHQSFPGNEMQLENLLSRALVSADGSTIDAGDLVTAAAGDTDGRSAKPQGRSPGRAVHLTDEGRRILAALEHCNGNKSRAAALLGMPRRTLYRRLKELGVV